MAKQEKEEIIFELKVDPKDATSELEKLKKSIIESKDEQKALNDAFKKGQITQREYIQESVRVENQLKKSQAQYNQTQKAVTGVKNAFDRLKDELEKTRGQLAKTGKSFEDAAKDINIAGVSVGGVTDKIKLFNNPATAAIGVATALGAAYARSTIGAKDLAFAQEQLAQATTLVTNQLASLISSSEDGEGAVTRLFNNALTLLDKLPAFFVPRTIAGFFGIDIEEIRKKSKELALIANKIEDLQREEADLRATANERLSDNQELLTQIQSDQTKYNEKVDKTNEIITNIRRNEEEIRGNLDKQLQAVSKKLDSDKANGALLDAQLAIKKELSALEKDSEKRVQAILRMQQNITDEERKRLLLIASGSAAQAKAAGIDLPSEVKSLADPNAIPKTTKEEEERTQSLIEGKATFQINSTKALNDALAVLGKQRVENERKNAAESVEITKEANIAKLGLASDLLTATSGLAEEGSDLQRALAVAGIAADTARAIAGGVASSQSVPYPGNLIAMVSTIAAVLANIARAKQILSGDVFAEGGYTGHGGKHEPAGIVHRGEYVVPKHIVHNPAYSGVLNTLEAARMRGFADGGLAIGSLTQPIDNAQNQAIATANIIKSLPPSEVSVKEITRMQKRVKVKESTAKAG